ncbi:ATP-binding protein [Actinomadura spongiicola]|uniref:ATP-binding protein n=1 Tax=Actinomadura spongiicola TaxID=2303421 RepID=A0A372GE62_9ACTN|nr:ATP-binding protein [Actinomadura spongiicola]RFS83671.1 ATP-binding protein [Actinomadura spongiicola]
MIILPSEASSAGWARDHINKITASWPVDSGDVCLITSELVTNAIQHAMTDVVAVHAYSWGRRYVLEVWDADETPPPLDGVEPSESGGRGLLLVSELACRWGVRHIETGGKVVYAEWTIP